MATTPTVATVPAIFSGVLLTVAAILYIYKFCRAQRRKSANGNRRSQERLVQNDDADAADAADADAEAASGSQNSTMQQREPQRQPQPTGNHKSARAFRAYADEYQRAVDISVPHQQQSCLMATRQRSKNRYGNIIPYDVNRVVLTPKGRDPSSTYINASHIRLGGSCYIAAQGPLESTTMDFYRMIVEQQVKFIVMLTKCKETINCQTNVKCHKYWPDRNKMINFGASMQVFNTEEILKGGYIERKLTVRDAKGKVYPVTQFQCITWPDKTVPTTTSGIHRLANELTTVDNKGPVVVHCSAGIGRTGTFIAYDAAIKSCNFGNLGDILVTMRKQRVLMIQTVEQYVFMANAVREYFEQLGSEFKLPALAGRTLSLNPNREFAKCQPINHLFAEHRLTPVNRSIFYADRTTEGYPGYYIELYGLFDRKALVIKDPLDDEIDAFWTTVLENSIKLMVTVEWDSLFVAGQSSPNGNSWRLCPYDGSSMAVFQGREEQTTNYYQRSMAVRQQRRSPCHLTQIVYCHFHRQQQNLRNFLDELDRIVQEAGEGNILIHSSAGNSILGIFLSIWNLNRRWKVEKSFDVVRTVKDLLEMKADLISVEQYAQIYAYLEHAFNQPDPSDE